MGYTQDEINIYLALKYSEVSRVGGGGVPGSAGASREVTSWSSLIQFTLVYCTNVNAFWCAMKWKRSRITV